MGWMQYINKRREIAGYPTVSTNLPQSIVKTPMPTEPPEYYQRYGITAVDGYYYWDQGGWTWKIGKEEKSQTDKAEEAHAKTPYTKTTRQNYSSVMYNGKWEHVWRSSDGRDYVQTGNSNERFYLDNDWWYTYQNRYDGNSHGHVETVAMMKDKLYYKLPKLSAFDGLKVPSVSLPKIGLPFKMGALAVVAFIGVIVLLVAVGYSGTGKAGSRIAEREHARRR